jgi:hypothetical protein
LAVAAAELGFPDRPTTPAARAEELKGLTPWIAGPLAVLVTANSEPVEAPVPAYGRERPAALCHSRLVPSVPSTWPFMPPPALSLDLPTPASAIPSALVVVPSPMSVESCVTAESPPVPPPSSESANCISNVVESFDTFAVSEPTGITFPVPLTTDTCSVRSVELTAG